jgi:hypothetical protein
MIRDDHDRDRDHDHGGIILRRVRDRERAEQIEQYIAAHAAACFAHRPAFRTAVRRAYRIPELLLAAFDGERVVGAAPFSLLWTTLAGAHLVLGPFAAYADVLADTNVIAHALLSYAVQLGRVRRLQHVQVRSVHGAPELYGLRGATESDRLVASRIDLSAGREAIWKRLPGGLRALLQDAERRISLEAGPRLDAFVRTCAAGARSSGAPAHGGAFFAALQHNFGEHAQLWLARERGMAITGALTIVDRNVMHSVHGLDTRGRPGSAAEALLVWHLIEQACERGMRAIDLGRSEHGSTYDAFLAPWRTETLPIADTYALIRARHVPEPSTRDPGARLARQAWSRLPLPLARRLGPLFVRSRG